MTRPFGEIAEKVIVSWGKGFLRKGYMKIVKT